MYKSLLSLRNSSTGYSFYCYCTLLKFIIIRTTCRQDKEQPNREHMKPIASEIIPPREENEVNILNYSTQIFRKIDFRSIPPGCSWLPHAVGPWRMQFAIQQVIKLFVDNTMPRETHESLELMVDSPVLPSASVCMWWLVCTAPFQVLLAFTSPSVSHGVTLSFSLSLSLSQTERREKGVWTSRNWNTEFFVWLLHMVSFKHAYWTHYAIIYFHI